MLELGNNIKTVLGGSLIKALQIGSVFIFGILIMMGVFYFLFAFKNPHKKRKAYIFTLVGSVFLLLFLYMPVVVVYYMQPENSFISDISTWNDLANTSMTLGVIAYNIITLIFEPLIFLAFFIGIGVLLLAARNPGRKRIGVSMVIASPIVWVLLQLVPSIAKFFVPESN